MNVSKENSSRSDWPNTGTVQLAEGRVRAKYQEWWGKLQDTQRRVIICSLVSSQCNTSSLSLSTNWAHFSSQMCDWEHSKAEPSSGLSLTWSCPQVVFKDLHVFRPVHFLINSNCSANNCCSHPFTIFLFCRSLWFRRFVLKTSGKPGKFKCCLTLIKTAHVSCIFLYLSWTLKAKAGTGRRWRCSDWSQSESRLNLDSMT